MTGAALRRGESASTIPRREPRVRAVASCDMTPCCQATFGLATIWAPRGEFGDEAAGEVRGLLWTALPPPTAALRRDRRTAAVSDCGYRRTAVVSEAPRRDRRTVPMFRARGDGPLAPDVNHNPR